MRSSGCIIFLCYSAFYEPPSDVIAGQIRASLKKEVALLPFDNHGISVALASGFHGSRLPYICYFINGVLFSVLPGNNPGEHCTVLGKIGIDGHIHLYGFWCSVHIVPLIRNSQYHPGCRYPAGNCSVR